MPGRWPIAWQCVSPLTPPTCACRPGPRDRATPRDGTHPLPARGTAATAALLPRRPTGRAGPVPCRRVTPPAGAPARPAGARPPSVPRPRGPSPGRFAARGRRGPGGRFRGVGTPWLVGAPPRPARQPAARGDASFAGRPWPVTDRGSRAPVSPPPGAPGVSDGMPASGIIRVRGRARGFPAWWSAVRGPVRAGRARPSGGRPPPGPLRTGPGGPHRGFRCGSGHGRR